MPKTVLIVVLILAILAVGGGSFYYFEVYQPQQYAASLLSLYQRLSLLYQARTYFQNK
ncbi:MAG: hypothetical protein G01um101470_772 [Parcubacteria group bacterium Gr01-1014_70]|nr:MAG: hypothetical protein G01um101470_772 [Parcubacteria group bacterium Gr01-1014_70]